MTWTKCEDALPEHGWHCIVYTEDGDYHLGCRTRTHVWRNDLGELLDGVKTPTHWMPVPEPPK